MNNLMHNKDMTPEESKAKANSEKINSFMRSVGWQFAVLGTVFYATVKDNSIAGYMMEAYAVLLVFSIVLFFLLIIKNSYKLAIVMANKGAELNTAMTLSTPTSKVLRVLGATCSIIEITLFFSYGWFYLGAFWVFGEILQAAAILKCRYAMTLIPEPSEFAKEVGEELKEFRNELIKLIALIEVIKTDDTLAQDVRKETVDNLEIEKDKMIALIEEYLTKVALQRVENDKE